MDYLPCIMRFMYKNYKAFTDYFIYQSTISRKPTAIFLHLKAVLFGGGKMWEGATLN